MGRFISSDVYTSTGQGLLGNNMFAYCGNSPVVHDDPTGRFPWFIFSVLAITAIVGGVLGYMSEEKLGPTNDEPDQVAEQNPLFYRESDPIPQDTPAWVPTEENESTELSTGDKVQNTLIGAGLGLAAGGAIVSTMGAAGAVIAGSSTAVIPLFGATGAQTFAIGALVYDAFAMLANAFFGLELETIEIEP